MKIWQEIMRWWLELYPLSLKKRTNHSDFFIISPIQFYLFTGVVSLYSFQTTTWQGTKWEMRRAVCCQKNNGSSCAAGLLQSLSMVAIRVLCCETMDHQCNLLGMGWIVVGLCMRAAKSAPSHPGDRHLPKKDGSPFALRCFLVNFVMN